MAKMNTNLDDWETDPDFVRDMDEMDQRWGSKRTVGSINMNELIDEVRRDHKTIRENNHHSSQRDYSSGLDRDIRQPVSYGFESEKKISRKVITESSESSYVKEATSKGDQTKQKLVETTTVTNRSNPIISPKPDFGDLTSRLYSGERSSSAANRGRVSSDKNVYDNVKTDPPKQFKELSTTKRIFEETKSSSSLSSSRDNVSPKSPSTGAPAALKSIQDKIDAFKKEFENIENKVAKKSDMSKVIKKSTNVEKFDDNVKYVTRSTETIGKTNPVKQRATTTSPSASNKSSSLASENRPSSTSPLYGNKKAAPQASIKSLSERFESLGRETSEDFRRRMDERRREFFDEIKTQVRETRKGLDGFDIIDSGDDDNDGGRKPQSKSKDDASYRTMSTIKPKVYTKRETTQEKIVSKFVKENDKIIHDETKRNVHRTSSCHGSSDEETNIEPTSIKHISSELKTSSQPASPSFGESKRKEEFVEPANKGSGLMARTLYDYQASEDDELTFDVDDLITNIEKLDKGWYKGTITRNGQKQVGLFPANYVKLLNDSSFY